MMVDKSIGISSFPNENLQTIKIEKSMSAKQFMVTYETTPEDLIRIMAACGMRFIMNNAERWETMPVDIKERFEEQK